MPEQTLNNKKQSINNSSNSITPLSIRDSTLVNENHEETTRQFKTLNDNETNKQPIEILDDDDLSENLNYKTIYPLSPESDLLTETLDFFNKQNKRNSSSLILPSSLKISTHRKNEEDQNSVEATSAVEAKDFIEGLGKFPSMTSSPITPNSSSEIYTKKPNFFNTPSIKSVNSLPQPVNQANASTSTPFSKSTSTTNGDIGNEEISYVIGSDSLPSFNLPLEDESLLTDDMKRRSYCSISNDPNYRLSISSISNIDLNNKRQSFYSFANNINNNTNNNTNNSNSTKTPLSNFSSEIIQVSGFTPPTSPILSKSSFNSNNINKPINTKSKTLPSSSTVTYGKTATTTNSSSLFTKPFDNKKDDKLPFDKSVLRPIETKEEKPSIDKSFFSQMENKDENVLFDRSFLRPIEPKEEKVSFDKAFFSQLENKDNKMPFNRSFLRQVDDKEVKEDHGLYDRSILRQVEDKEVKEEKGLYDRSILRQVEEKNPKEEKGLYDRSFLRQVDNKETKENKTSKNLYNRTSLRPQTIVGKSEKSSVESSLYSTSKLKPNLFSPNGKPNSEKSKSETITPKSFNRVRSTQPVNPFKDNIFIQKSHSQGSTVSSPKTKEIISSNEMSNFERRRNRTSDPVNPSSLRHNKSTSNINSKTIPSMDKTVGDRMNSTPLKSKIDLLKGSENLRRSSSYSCIQVSPSSSNSVKPPLKTSTSMILSSNNKVESTKLNPLVNSDEETHTPQKVIDNLNKLNVESKKTTLSDVPKIILSMAEFVGVILVDKTNQLLNYFEKRYPQLHHLISVLQVITRYLPVVVGRAFEIFNHGCRLTMTRIQQVQDYCKAKNIPFPEMDMFVRLFNHLKNQIVEKVMLASNGQLLLPTQLSSFLSRIQDILKGGSFPKKGGLSFSKNDIQIQNITISGPVGGHPMSADDTMQFDFGKKVEEPLSTTSITLVQNNSEGKASSNEFKGIKKVDEPLNFESEIIHADQTDEKSNKTTSPYDESRIVTKYLSSDTTLKEGSYPFFKPVRRPDHETSENAANNRLSDDLTLVASNRNSYISTDSSYISDTSRNSINKTYSAIVQDPKHRHRNSATSNSSINEPIIKDNARVNNLIELFEKQMSQTNFTNKSFDDENHEIEGSSLPSQPPQTNPRTYSLKYSLKQRQQKTSSMVSDDLVSISTSDSSEFEKVDFEDNLDSPKSVSYTSGHRRSHSQPDDSFYEDKEEREDEISLSQEISSELRHQFSKAQERNEANHKKEPIRTQSMIFSKPKPSKTTTNELLMAVKNLKSVNSTTRLSVPSNDIRNSSLSHHFVTPTPEIMNSATPLVKSPSVSVPPEASLAFKREKIVEEIFQTEKTYVKELASIVHLYLDPLDTVPGHFLDMQEYKTLFGNLRDIFDFHNEAFAPRLEKSCFPDRNKSIVPPPSVGAFFQMNAPVLANLYGEYYTNSNMANNFLTRIQNSKSSRFSTSLVNNKPKEAIFKKENKKRLKKFKTFLQWVCGQPEHTQMSLQGYLLLPVQRLPRYLLLLEQLLKNTRETEKEYRDLSKAKEAIRMVVEQCNERIRRFEEKKRVIEIISNIRLCSSNVHSLGSKMIKNSTSAHNKRLLLDTVPAKTKVEFFVKLQNMTKLEELHLIKEGRFQIYKVKQCDPKVTANASHKKNKNSRREPSDFSSSPALRAQRAAHERMTQRSFGMEGKAKMTKSFGQRPMSTISNTSTNSAPPSSSIRRRKTRRRSSLESLSPPFIKMLREDQAGASEATDHKMTTILNKISDDEEGQQASMVDTVKRSYSTTIEDSHGIEEEEAEDDGTTLKYRSISVQDPLTSTKYDAITNTLPTSAIWEQVYLINNNLVEVLSSTNELVRIMELVKPKVGHLPNSILNAGCQVDIIIENGIQMLTVCDGHVMIYLMGLKEDLFEWKEAIEKIIQ